MAYIFGDSFDLYSVVGDAITSYWDSGALPFAFNAGRFGGQALRTSSSGVWLVKSSGANDAIHHVVCAFQQTAVLSGTTLGVYLQLSDAATNQVCIVFRSDGAILLTSATPAGTVLATYTGATTLQSQWFAYEFEVVIHPTAGRFRVRKNNNTSDDFDSGATLNTRPGANSYANKLTLGNQTAIGNHIIDDLLWRSDASSVPFVGDIRTYVRMPVSDASVQFSRVPATVQQPTFGTVSSFAAPSATISIYSPITPATSGTVGSILVLLNVAITGNLKCSVFASSGTVPTTVIASATTITNPTTGTNTFTFGTPFTVVAGTQYWVGLQPDVTQVNALSCLAGTTGKTSSTAYASFPVASPPSPANNAAPICSFVITLVSNAQVVSETQQDSAATYVYSSNVGDADLYGIAPIAVTPAGTVAVTTRAFVSKSDAGSRNGKVLLKSGSTTVDSGSATLATYWMNMWRTDTVDPATGVAWTPTGVNSVNVGVQVTS